MADCYRKLSLLSSVTAIYVFFGLNLILSSCASTKTCPDEPAIGNVGGIINTDQNDHMPLLFDESLYFTSTREEQAPGEKLYVINISEGHFTNVPLLVDDLPVNDFPNIMTPAIYRDPNGRQELYFTATDPDDKRGDRNIYYSENTGSGWTEPIVLRNGISTDSYESHPTISPDGSMLAFTSDRQGGKGSTDIWLSFRAESGWETPVNAEKINTIKPEIAPAFDENMNFYFSSKGYLENSGFDIIRSTFNNGILQDIKPLEFPVNSSFDESGITFSDDKYIISSNRKNGCGAWDIYMFDRCGPVLINGKISSSTSKLPVSGLVTLMDIGYEVLENAEVNDEGGFQFNVKPNKEYILRYENPCFSDISLDQNVKALCSDTSTVEMIITINLPDDLNIFSFKEYKVPFFVSGYYLPNTSENLEDLRRKFTYNLFGTTDSTRYIENPGDKYDKYSETIDIAINDAVDYILERVRYLDSDCAQGNSFMKIELYGYADPRPLSVMARYSGEDIYDKNIGLSVNRGEQMTNHLLSSLRAYYTALLLIERIEERSEFKKYQDRVIWTIRGEGIDKTSGISNDMRRHVLIRFGIE